MLLRVLFIILITIAFRINTGYAQNGSLNTELSISITTEVVETIELFTLQNINLGVIQPSQQTVTVDPVTSPNAGIMLATGNPNSILRVSYRDQVELQSSDGNEIIIFKYRVSGSSQYDQSTSEYLEPESKDLSFNESGEYFFWIGGSTDISNITGGKFEGDFTFEVEYN